MTSLTTMISMMPFLFGTDPGSERQKPFALTVIGGMSLGTFVSIFYSIGLLVPVQKTENKIDIGQSGNSVRLINSK